MARDTLLDRRAFLRRASQIGIATMTASSAFAVTACTRKRGGKGQELGEVGSCDGTTKLTAQEQAQRKDLKYVERSPNGDKQNCTNCIRFIQPSDDMECGACGVIAGPINPNGYCNDWEPKDL